MRTRLRDDREKSREGKTWLLPILLRQEEAREADKAGLGLWRCLATLLDPFEKWGCERVVWVVSFPRALLMGPKTYVRVSALLLARNCATMSYN